MLTDKTNETWACLLCTVYETRTVYSITTGNKCHDILLPFVSSTKLLVL